MTWRPAKSITKLREQVDAAYPKRSMASDGIIGDPAHSSRTSDHNPDPSSVVRAIDITHDPRNGCDCNSITAALVKSRDPRIKYIIWTRRIISGAAGPSPWVWRSYTGSNPHDKHLHLSVVADSRADSTKQWSIREKGDWFDMASKNDLRQVIREELAKAIDQIQKDASNNRRLLAVGKTQKSYNPDKVNLKTLGGK